MDHFYNLIELIILNKYDLCNPKQASHFPLNTFLVIFQIWSQIEWDFHFKSCDSFDVENILTLIDLERSLPPTSILNETSFNQMKIIKSNRRHRLTNTHLNNCMVIRLESPTISQFDPSSAIDNWMVYYTTWI
jgi:hypothetical protein